MADFATHPGCRGRNLPGYLLALMEEVMRAAGMRTAFTIARGLSYPSTPRLPGGIPMEGRSRTTPASAAGV